MNPIDGLLLACSDFDKKQSEPKIIRWLDTGLDWDVVLKSAANHALVPMLHYHLSGRVYKDRVPPEILKHLRDYGIASVADSLRKKAVLEKILVEFEDSGVEPIILKGPALAQTLYPETGLRQYADFDILIKESDWPKVRAGLMRLDFSPTGKDYTSFPPRFMKETVFDHWFSFHNSNGIKIDCKFDLLELGLRTKSLDNIWERTISFGIGKRTAKKLSIEDELLLLCVHLNRHGFSRLAWFLDIAELLKKHEDQMDWDYICSVARQDSVKPVLFFTLIYVEKLLGVPIPEKAKGRLKPSWLKSAIWRASWPEKSILAFDGRRDEVITFYKSLCFKWFLPNLLLMGRVGDKLTYFIKRIAPPKDYIVEKHQLDKTRSNSNYFRYLYEHYKILLRQRFGNMFNVFKKIYKA